MHILVLAINIYHSFDIYIKIPDKCMPRVNSLVSTAGNDTHRLELRVNISLRIYAKIFSS